MLLAGIYIDIIYSYNIFMQSTKVLTCYVDLILSSPQRHLSYTFPTQYCDRKKIAMASGLIYSKTPKK